MADNITGSPYGSNDVGLTVGIELGNIDRSTEQAGALADQIKQWRENNEAFIKSIADTQEALAMLTTEFDKQNSLRKETVAAEESLRDITAQVRDNARSTAQAYQEINGVLSTMNTNLGVSMVPGMGTVGGGTSFSNAGRATSSSWDSGDVAASMLPPSSGGSSPSPSSPSMGSTSGTSGAYDPTLDDMYGGGDAEEDYSDVTASSGYNYERALKRMGTPERGNARLEENAISRLFSRPGGGFLGKIGVKARYLNRLTTNGGNGLFSRMAQHPRIVGSRRFTTGSQDYLARQLTAEHAASVGGLDEAGTRDMFESAQKRLGGLDMSGMTREQVATHLKANGLTVSEEAITGAMGQGALKGGALGFIGKASPYVAGAMAIGQAAYGVYSQVEQAGQTLGSLTGNSSNIEGAKLLGQAASMSGFGFNPRMSQQNAMEILSTGLGKGYRGDLQKQFTGFAYHAGTQYGMSGQESMAMFHDAVVNAGGSVANLTKNLDSLANTATNTQTSLKQMTASQGMYTSILSSMGGGSATSDIATGAASAMAGNLTLAEAPKSLGMMATLQGQAMTAMQMGIPMSQLYSAGKSTLGAMQIAGATEDYQRKMLQSIVGVSPQSPGFEAAVESKWLQLSTVLNQISPPQGDEKPWDAKRAVEYTKKILKHQGGVAEGIVGEANRSITGMLGGEALASDKGMTNLFKNLESTVFNKGKQTIDGHKANDVMVNYKDSHGTQRTVESGAIANMDYKTKMDIYKQMAAGGYHVAQAYKDSDGKIHQGKMQTMGKQLGNEVMDAYERGKISTQQLLQLTPEAKTLVTLLKDPSQANKNVTRHAARTGYGGGNAQSAQHSSTGGSIWSWAGSHALALGEIAVGAGLSATGVGGMVGAGLVLHGVGQLGD